MKKTVLILGIIASLAFGQIVNAAPITSSYADNELNWATWTATNNNNIDPLGTPSIDKTDVTMDILSLQMIKFIGTGISHPGVFSGDLFINTSINDLVWDYVVRALGTTLNGTATLGLYAIAQGYDSAIVANRPAYTYSSYTPYNPAQGYNAPADGSVRGRLPVGLLDTPTSNSLGDVAYTATNTAITFDFASAPITFGEDFIIGYTVTCANDVIYEEVPVPEPGTLVLFGFGLIGLAIYGKRRMNKEA